MGTIIFDDPADKGSGRLVKHEDDRIGIIYHKDPEAPGGKLFVNIIWASRQDLIDNKAIDPPIKIIASMEKLSLIGFTD